VSIFSYIFGDPVAAVDAVGVRMEAVRRDFIAARAAGDQPGIDAALAEMQRLSNQSQAAVKTGSLAIDVYDLGAMGVQGVQDIGNGIVSVAEWAGDSAGGIGGATLGAFVEKTGLTQATIGLLIGAGAVLYVFSTRK
jgi:hypothetical protein